MLVFVLSRLGWLPPLPNAENAIEVGLAGLIIMLSFALTARLNEERRSKLAAQQEALHHEQQLVREQQHSLDIMRQASAELEQNVARRTHDLNVALKKLEHANAQLHLLSTVDSLTGLKNRRYFDQAYQQELSRMRRDGSDLSLLLLDIDHFKRINDTWGHAIGDECLKLVATAITTQIRRETDTLARIGGEEFCLLLPHTSAAGAYFLAESIRRAVEALTAVFDGQRIPLSISIGIASTSQQLPVPDSRLQKLADLALYQSKKDGRNRVTLFDSATMSESA